MILISFFGMMLILDASDLLEYFLGLELQAFAYYTIIALKPKSLFASEGSLKYFLMVH